jgi:hypothetical protein
MLMIMNIHVAILAGLLLAGADDNQAAIELAHSASAHLHYEGPSDLPGAGNHIVLIAGDEEYRSEEALPMLAAILAKRHGFDCTVLFSTNPESGEIDPMNQVHMPGLELLANADLVILFTRFREWPDEDMQYFVNYVDSGKPIVGIRTATHAFKYDRNTDSSFARYSSFDATWDGGFGRQILGETWVNHHGGHGSQSTRALVEEDNADHPILRGFTHAWGPTDVYGVRELPDDAIVLLRGQVLEGMSPNDVPAEGDKNNPMMPLVWARVTLMPDKTPESKSTTAPLKRRTVCTTLGASEDFESEGLRRVLVNSALWCLELEHLIGGETDVTYVGEYAPTPFGHGNFKRGLTPRHYELKR